MLFSALCGAIVVPWVLIISVFPPFLTLTLSEILSEVPRKFISTPNIICPLFAKHQRLWAPLQRWIDRGVSIWNVQPLTDTWFPPLHKIMIETIYSSELTLTWWRYNEFYGKEITNVSWLSIIRYCCILLRIISFMNFVHHPVFYKLETGVFYYWQSTYVRNIVTITN
jgi:hypothetical protein